MSFFGTLSIRRKLVWLMTLTSAAALILASAALFAYEWFAAREGMVADLKTQAEIIAANVSGALAFADEVRATETLKPLQTKPNVISAFLLAQDGSVFAQYVRAGESASPPTKTVAAPAYWFENGRLALAHPVVFGGEPLGRLYLSSDSKPMWTRLKQYLRIVGLVLVVALTAAFWLAFRLQRVISGPIAELSKSARLVSTEKDFSIRVPRQNQDELGLLIDGFNEMLNQIQHRDDSLRQAHEQLEERVAERTSQLAQEVADRKHAELALAKEKELLTVTLGSIADVLITTDTSGRVMLFNGAAERFTSCQAGDAIGRNWNDVLHVVFAANGLAPETFIRDILTADRVIDFPPEAIFVGPTGERSPVAGSGAPIHDRGGGVIGVVMAFRDITVERRLASELMKSSKLESLGLLAGGIAHDFNNILTAIVGNISLARRFSESNSRALGRLEEAERASLRAKDLTGQLLTFSKGGSPVKTATSIARLILETTQFALRGSNVRAEFSLPSDLWPAEVDETQISQVIANLVINSTQATVQGGVIEIQARNLRLETPSHLPLMTGAYIHLLVRDHGTGIHPDHLLQIFDPYFTTKKKGSGLGLTTAFSIVKKHGGHITAESVLGNGATFHVYLPAAPNLTALAPQPVAVPETGSGRVLVMDDEAIIRDLLKSMLETLGYEIEAVSHGAEAIDRYVAAREAGQPFSVVILDLTVPGGMGGKEAMEKLRSLDPEIVAIVSSGHYHDAVMANYQAYGFKGALSKPYTLGVLAQALQQSVSPKRLALERLTPSGA